MQLSPQLSYCWRLEHEKWRCVGGDKELQGPVRGKPSGRAGVTVTRLCNLTWSPTHTMFGSRKTDCGMHTDKCRVSSFSPPSINSSRSTSKRHWMLLFFTYTGSWTFHIYTFGRLPEPLPHSHQAVARPDLTQTQGRP